jgi:hypothetical protein
MDVPQVYVYANDGAEGDGTASLCNVHSPDAEASFADYDPTSGRWDVVQDPARNQMQRMMDSPHLCPAMPFATGGRSSDRVPTQAGDLYHACRYLGCNQVATDHGQFGREAYEDAVVLYRAVEVLRAAVEGARGTSEPPVARVRRIAARQPALRERAVAVLREAVAVAGLVAADLQDAGLPADVVTATVVEPRPRTATVPLGLPVFVLGADAPGSGPAGQAGPGAGPAAAAGCGSCR